VTIQTHAHPRGGGGGGGGEGVMCHGRHIKAGCVMVYNKLNI